MREKTVRAISLILVLLFFAPLAVSPRSALAASRFYVRDDDHSDFSEMMPVFDYSRDNFFGFNGLETDVGDDGSLTAKKESGGTFYGVFEYLLDLSAYNEISFSIRSDGAGGEFSFGITLSSGGVTYDAAGVFAKGDTHFVSMPVADFDGRGSIDHIYFTFTGADSVTLSPFFADSKYTYSHLDRFLSDSFSSENEITLTERAVYISPSDGAGSIEAAIHDGGEGESRVVRVNVFGVQGGSMILSLRRDDGSYSDISTVQLFPGSNTYTFIDGDGGAVDSYRISFAGVGDTDSIGIGGVAISYYDEKIEKEEADYPGVISSCALSSDGRTMRLKGSLSTSFVVDNMGSGIGIYAVDLWDETVSVPVTEADISTVLDLSFSVSDLSLPAGFYRYFIAVRGEPENALSAPVYPTAGAQSVQNAPSVLGVESRDTSVPFDSAAPYTVVEVNVDRLLSEDAAGARFHSFAGGYYYFDVNCTSELDRTIGFYIASGELVYVRLVYDGADGAVYSLPDADDMEAVISHAAAVDYLTERYPDIAGIILGRKINVFTYNKPGADDGLFGYAEKYVKLLRVTLSAARANSPSASVAVPIGDSYVYSDAPEGTTAFYNDMTGVGDNACDPMFLSVLISKYMMSGGAIPWTLVYECEVDPAGCAEILSLAAARLVQNVGASPTGQMLYWRPDHAIDDSELETLSARMTESSSALGTKCLVVSLAEQEGDERYIASRLAGLTFESTPVRRTAKGEAEIADGSPDGQVFIMDFRRSWGVGSFAAGGSVSSLTTEASGALSEIEGVEGCRAIRATSDGGAGLIVSFFDTPTDLTGAEDLNAVISVTGDTGEYPVKIIVGNAERRAVYDVTADGASRIACKLEDVSPDDATYIAVEVRSDGAYTLELSSVSLSRADGDSSKIPGSGGKDDDADRAGTVVAVVTAASVFTLLVFTVVTVAQNLRKKEKK